MNEQEVLFYGEVSNFSVSSFINRMAEAKSMRKDVNILANSMGGDADAGFGMIVSIRDYPYNKKLSVHGSAYSMMAFACLFVNEVEALEQSIFLFHRAAAFFLFEEEPGIRELLVKRNATLRKAMEEKLDIEAFERISGVTLDELFDMDQRIDVSLTSEEAEEVGLVTKVIPLSAVEPEEINTRMMAASAGVGVQPIKISNNVMNLDELKKKHPELYAQAVNAGKEEALKQQKPVLSPAPEPKKPQTEIEAKIEAAVSKERNRVAAWQAWSEVDAKKVAAGIESGAEITIKEISEFTLQAAKNNFGKGLQDNGKPPKEDPAKETDGLSEDLEKMSANVTENFKKKFQKTN